MCGARTATLCLELSCIGRSWRGVPSCRPKGKHALPYDLFEPTTMAIMSTDDLFEPFTLYDCFCTFAILAGSMIAAGGGLGGGGVFVPMYILILSFSTKKATALSQASRRRWGSARRVCTSAISFCTRSGATIASTHSCWRTRSAPSCLRRCAATSTATGVTSAT